MICATDRDEVRNRWFEGVAGHVHIREAPSRDVLEDLLGRAPDDFVLLHLALPGIGGISGVKELSERFPNCRLFCFADTPSDPEGLQLLQCGVSGYANTYMNPGLLRQAVEVIESGQVWLGQRLMQALIRTMATGRQSAPVPVHEPNPVLDKLTVREKEIAAVLAEGASNKIIARKLDITERTVKAHLTSIFEKTGTKDRLELALLVQGAAGKATLST